MRVTFAGFNKSGFRFPKFHLTTHYPQVIEEFGSLHTVSSAHGERTHKTEVKPAHKRTSQKKRTANNELLDVLQAKESLEQLVSAYGIASPVGTSSRRKGIEDAAEAAIFSPGSTLSGYVYGDHVLQGQKFTLRNYNHSDVPRAFRFPHHEAAFAGYMLICILIFSNMRINIVISAY